MYSTYLDLTLAGKKGGTGVNFINILLTPFSYTSGLRSFSLISLWLRNFLAKEYRHKSWLKNVDEIDYRTKR